MGNIGYDCRIKDYRTCPKKLPISKHLHFPVSPNSCSFTKGSEMQSIVNFNIALLSALLNRVHAIPYH